jgi:5-methylcytosine-specific restriction endonuclease McrA
MNGIRRRKIMNKRNELRQKIWLKYNKHCAYCGKILEYKDMQVDHMISKYAVEMYRYPERVFGSNFKIDCFDNLMPSCRRCNHYKRGDDLEGFRKSMVTLHERIQNQYIMKVAIDYGILHIKPFNGIFYFELLKEGD